MGATTLLAGNLNHGRITYLLSRNFLLYIQCRSKMMDNIIDDDSHKDLVFAVPQQPAMNPSSKGMTDEIHNINITNNNGAQHSLAGHTLQGAAQQAGLLFSKWGQTFAESESFEQFCPSRLDEIIKEAKMLEAKLKEQKKQLKNRLSLLSETLTSLPSCKDTEG